MEIKYKMNDGAIIIAPNASVEAFWTALRDSSKFDSELHWQQYRLNFIERWNLFSGRKWHEVYQKHEQNQIGYKEGLQDGAFIRTEFDIKTLVDCGVIIKIDYEL